MTASPTATAALPSRLPNLIMGAVALFLAVFFAGTLLAPQQVFAESAAKWQNLLVTLAAFAVLAWGMELGSWREPDWFFATSLLFVLADISRWQGEFSWAGSDWTVTLFQGWLALVTGGALATHFARQVEPGARNRCVATVGWAAVLVAAFLCADALHQLLVRLPRQAAELLASGPLGEFEQVLYDAMAGGRVSSRFGNPNVLAGALCMAWPLVVGRQLVARALPVRLGLAALAWGAMPAIVLMTGSRGGVLTALATGLLVAWFWRGALLRRTRMTEVGTGIALCLLLAFAAPRLAQTPPARDVEANGAGRFTRPATITMRLGFLEAGARMAANLSPRGWLIGEGPGSYEYLYLQHQTPGRQESRYAHCFPLQVFVETGLVGLLLHALVFLPALLPLLRRRPPPADDAATFGADAQLLAWPLGIAAFLGNGLVEITPYIREAWLMAMLLAGLTVGHRWGGTWEKIGDPLPQRFGAARGVVAALLLLIMAFTPVGRRVQSISHIASARETSLAEAQAPAPDFPLTPEPIAEVKESAKRAGAIFGAGIEQWLLLHDLGESCARALDAGMVTPEALAPAREMADARRVNLQQALNRAPRSASLYMRMATLESDPARTLELMEEAQKLHPAKTDYRMARARLLAQRGHPGDLARARELATEAIALEYRANRIEIWTRQLEALNALPE